MLRLFFLVATVCYASGELITKPNKDATERSNKLSFINKVPQSMTAECPAEDFGKPTLLPHSSDCDKFYICDKGTPHLKSCQLGLHFNVRLQVCDFPEKAGCPTGENKENRDDKTGRELIETDCPLENGAFPTYLPHETDCGKFYSCDHGVPHLKECLPGLHFNPKLKVCDYPVRAGCQKSPHLQKASGIPSSFCPEVDGKEKMFFVHPKNCSVYYMCSHGLAYEFACPSRLHFNLKTKYCDYEELAGCQKGKEEDKLQSIENERRDLF